MEYLPEDDLSEQSQRHSYVRITNVQRLTRPQISAACTTRPTNSMPPPSLPKKRKSLYRKPAQELWSFHPMTLTRSTKCCVTVPSGPPLQHSARKGGLYNMFG